MRATGKRRITDEELERVKDLSPRYKKLWQTRQEQKETKKRIRDLNLYGME